MCEVDVMESNIFFKSDSFCQACLSTDRKLSSAGEYNDIYMYISNNSCKMNQPVYLCWECMALLKRIKCFKSKIEEAQRLLGCHFINKEKSLLKTLSKLTKNYTDSTIIITHDDDIKDDEHLEIKQEKQSDDEFNCEERTNDLGLEEIKQQNQSDNEFNYEQNTIDLDHKEKNVTDKKCNKKSKKYYIIDFEIRNKVLRKKFSIKPEDLKIWWDTERNSDFYKNFKYQCKMCVHGFEWKEKLKAHIMKYHDESIGPYICSTCNMRFSTEGSRGKHMLTHMRAWQCTHCGFQCYTLRRLNAHLIAHNRVQCAYCDAQFPTVATFFSHYKLLHSAYICDHCGKRSMTKRTLEKHMRTHLEIHECSVCSRRYKSRAALRKHCYVKHEDTRAENCYCVLCDKQYHTAVLYRRHVQSSAAHAHERDKQANKKFPCPECSNVYSRRTYMMNHYRHVHVKQTKYYCSVCDRHFLNRTRYSDHIRYSHEGVKKEKNKLCNICGRGFATNRTLINHIRTHSGERPYECEYCSAKFTQKTSMLSHVKCIHMKSKRLPQWQQ